MTQYDKTQVKHETTRNNMIRNNTSTRQPNKNIKKPEVGKIGLYFLILLLNLYFLFFLEIIDTVLHITLF